MHAATAPHAPRDACAAEGGRPGCPATQFWIAWPPERPAAAAPEGAGPGTGRTLRAGGLVPPGAGSNRDVRRAATLGEASSPPRRDGAHQGTSHWQAPRGSDWCGCAAWARANARSPNSSHAAHRPAKFNAGAAAASPENHQPEPPPSTPMSAERLRRRPSSRQLHRADRPCLYWKQSRTFRNNPSVRNRIFLPGPGRGLDGEGEERVECGTRVRLRAAAAATNCQLL